MNEGYRIERSGRRHWRIVRADGATLPAWEYRGKAAAEGALKNARAGELDQEWTRYQQWVRVAMSDSWDEENDE